MGAGPREENRFVQKEKTVTTSGAELTGKRGGKLELQSLRRVSRARAEWGGR